MVKKPVKIVIELKGMESLETALNELERVRDSHPDTTLNTEIRV